MINNEALLNGLKYHPETLRAFLEGKDIGCTSPTFNKHFEYKIPAEFVVDEFQEDLKTVCFHGIMLIIPKGISYIAVDADGTVCLFVDKPTTLCDFWERSSGFRPLCITLTYSGDWEKSLWKIKQH